MRTPISAWAVVAGQRSRLRGASAGTLVLAAFVAIVAFAPSGVGPARTHAAAPSGRRADPPPPASRARYRLVGCRSRAGTFRSGPPRRAVAFGFDDGPWTQTAAFVRMLERAHAPATFFLIGRQLSGGSRALLLRELRAGGVLGDHTFNHPDLTRVAGARGELQRTATAIAALSGYTPCVFRPPYGAYDRAVVATAHSLGLATVLWSVDPADWTRPGAAAIVQRVLAGVRPGAIVVSHDGGGPRQQTLAAYPAIIAALRRRHYAIVTIPQLLGFRPLYAACSGACDGLGLARSQLPRDAIVLGSRGRL